MFWYSHLKIAGLKENETKRIFSTNYIIKKSILRQKSLYSDCQEQTRDAFDYKWNKRETYESEAMKSASRTWLIERYFAGEIMKINSLLKPGLKVLDAGCGSGYSAQLLFSQYFNDIHYLGVDISAAVDVAYQRFLESGSNGEFIQADLMDLPFRKPTFDLVFSEGVLHHTDSTEKAIHYLSTLLLPGGKFLFYVYNQKGPIREFTDDYIRKFLKNLNDKEAWDALVPLTKLGQALGEKNVIIDIPEAIPFLNIPAGKIDLQRFIYWYVFKAYYRPEFSLDEMNHINFDWYRPLNCHRQTPEQVKEWCSAAGLVIEHMNIQESGITVIARKPGKRT
jgi:arsenite methyltransferase